MGLVGNRWANCFRTHNELTMGLLGKYPLAPSDNILLAKFYNECIFGGEGDCPWKWRSWSPRFPYKIKATWYFADKTKFTSKNMSLMPWIIDEWSHETYFSYGSFKMQRLPDPQITPASWSPRQAPSWWQGTWGTPHERSGLLDLWPVSHPQDQLGNGWNIHLWVWHRMHKKFPKRGLWVFPAWR